jgi:prolipoprotein diacylglyceryl transferase
VLLAAIPSPATAVWHVGPLPIRAYALCMLAGIAVAIVITERRLQARGVRRGTTMDLAIWAVPAGIVGARVYHVITSPQGYFGAAGEPVRVLYLWEGGLSIWGAVLGGTAGAWYAARKLGVPLSTVADALAPALPVAQAIGRLGNWFNNEVYGRVTTLPWGLEIHDMATGETKPELYHPVFAYEAIWCLGVAALVWSVDRRFNLGRGRAFAVYVLGYAAGRLWIEMLRIDDANTFLGVRLNVFTAVITGLLAVAYLVRVHGPAPSPLPKGSPARPLG